MRKKYKSSKLIRKNESLRSIFVNFRTGIVYCASFSRGKSFDAISKSRKKKQKKTIFMGYNALQISEDLRHEAVEAGVTINLKEVIF